ncbi:MAG TPA: tetratricopeptide repeat protein [Opitutaceae bacterium]
MWVRRHAITIAIAAGTVAGWAGCSRSEPDAGSPPRPELSRAPGALTIAIKQAEAAIKEKPGDAGARLKLGQLYQANGFPAEAGLCFRYLTPDETVGARACYYLVREMELRGDLAGESHWLEETLRRDPGYLPARLLLAEARFKSGNPEEAVLEYEEALKGDPENAEALVGLARERLRVGDDAGAVEILEKLTGYHPTFSTGFALLAQVADRTGDAARAASVRVKARICKDPPRSDLWIDELMQYCFDVQQLAMRFEDYVKAGREKEGLLYLQQLEAVDDEHPLVCQMRALAAAQKGLFAEAVHEYERALVAGGDPARIYPALVVSLAGAKRYADAISRGRTGLQIAPHTPALFVALADVHLAQDDRSEAERLLNLAIAEAPENVEANRALSRLYWERGDREKAAACLRIIQHASPSDVPSRALLGQYYLENEDPAKAVVPLAEAYAFEPDNESLADMLALARMRCGNREAQAGRLTEAVSSYDAALAVRPELAEAWANKVQILMHLGQLGPAEEAMRHLVALRPENPTTYISLGDIQRSAGKSAAARESWLKAAQLIGQGGGEELRAAISARLQSLNPK